MASVGLCLGAAYVNYAQILNRAFVAYPNRALVAADNGAGTDIAPRTYGDIADYNGRIAYVCARIDRGSFAFKFIDHIITP